MLWFSVLFPLAMILSPLAFALAVRTAPDGAPEAVLRLLRRNLVAATAASLGLFGILWWLAGPAARFAGFLALPLFLRFAMPLAAARNPAWGGPHAGSLPVRTASLVDRSRERSVPRWILIAAAAIPLAAIALILLRPWGPAGGEQARRLYFIALTIAATDAAVLLPVLLLSLRRLADEPEPLDAAGSQELRNAYAALRRFRANALAVCLGLGLNLLVASIAVTLAAAPNLRVDGAALGLAGGIAGSAVGIAGAVIGTVAGRRRAQIHRLLRDLSAGEPPPQQRA